MIMSELGRLTPSTPGDLTYLSGHLYTLRGRMAVVLEGDVALCDQQRPSHRIKMRALDGSYVEIGAAWLKTARNGPQKGKKFLSIQVDHPERSGPLNVAAFLDEKTGDCVISWRRRGDQSPTHTATAA
jgi:uncharacterized protein (DUF736 family)